MVSRGPPAPHSFAIFISSFALSTLPMWLQPISATTLQGAYWKLEMWLSGRFDMVPTSAARDGRPRSVGGPRGARGVRGHRAGAEHVLPKEVVDAEDAVHVHHRGAVPSYRGAPSPTPAKASAQGCADTDARCPPARCRTRSSR